MRGASLLRAAAAEALLKGRAARLGHRFVVKGAFVPYPGTGNGHDLVRLAEQTRFRMSPDDRELLDRYSEQLELARYPVAKKRLAGLIKSPDPKHGYFIRPSYLTRDEATFRALTRRLKRSIVRPGR